MKLRGQTLQQNFDSYLATGALSDMSPEMQARCRLIWFTAACVVMEILGSAITEEMTDEEADKAAGDAWERVMSECGSFVTEVETHAAHSETTKH